MSNFEGIACMLGLTCICCAFAALLLFLPIAILESIDEAVDNGGNSND